MAKINVKYTTVAIHIFIWSLLFTLPHLFFDNRATAPGALPSSFFTITNLYNIGLFYLNALVLCPLFLNRRKWWAFVLSIAFVILASYYIKIFIVTQWYPLVTIDEWAFHILFFAPFPFLVISTIYRLVVNKIAYDKRQKEIVAEQLAMKLKFLRSQISPHFIFNVLTNLVSLARKRSDQLEPQLIKLSELMRYVLYESDEKKIAVEQEVEYLKSYIELQKLRFGNDMAIDVDVDIPGKDTESLIEPMLLIPFVENAFKHGMGIDEAFIKISLRANNHIFEFDVKNRFSKDFIESRDVNSGIGLENVRSRLVLLYPTSHKLVIAEEADTFHVHLTLQLK